MALIVLKLSSLSVAQDMVCFGNQLKLRLSIRVFRIAIGVKPECKLTKTALDLFKGDPFPKTKNLIVITIVHSIITAGEEQELQRFLF